ncbi:MutS protein 5 [Fasciola gigantica]|uniref:MutS protein 5 n=1 Tax=Fasciola gigantica TaxID=46835 RepID=A0A504YUQ2_FASGI|nr:MutS protein 5 [Fasciola gigantica]
MIQNYFLLFSLCAYAMAAISMNGVRPKIVEGSMICIKNGWHPLQQLMCSNTVRNSFNSDPVNPRVTVITGPNASGKSIYSKQVCLIVYLTQIGSFVPAEEVVIGLVDGIYTLTSAESLGSNGHSSFKVSLNLASMAIRNATKDTLILFDEFAHCLDEHEVTALTVAIVEYFLDRSESPHVVVCTHNFDILNSLQERSGVKFVVSLLETVEIRLILNKKQRPFSRVKLCTMKVLVNFLSDVCRLQLLTDSKNTRQSSRCKAGY